VVGSSIWVPKWLYRTLRMRVGVLVEGVWMSFPTLVVGRGLESILWWE